MSLSKLNKRKLLLGSTLVSFSVAAAFPMYAQDNTEEEEAVEEVVVTGIRTSIRNSLEAKKGESSIIEAISAEDIGKLPDISIAESIARLPGLAAQRTRGRAQVISVRGLGPDFTTGLLNGREQVTTGDNRGIEFDQYPAELISQGIIYKSPDASLIGQAIGGTVDLRTIRPLEYGKQAINLNGRYEWNSQGDLNAGSNEDGFRFTASYIDQFANDTFGIALGVASQSSPTQAERWDAWGYPDIDGDLIIGGAKPYVESRDLERDAFFGTVEYAPNDQLTVTGDVFYTDYKDGGILRGIELPLYWSGAQLQPGYTVENGLVTSGQFNGVKGVVRNDKRARDANLTSLALNTEYKVNDDWTLSADISSSKAERDDIDLETYSGTGAGGNGATDNLGFSIGEGGGFVFDSSLNYADPNTIVLTDPGGWGQVGFLKEPSTDDELTAIRLDSEHFVGGDVIESIEYGINHTSREKDKISIENFVDLANPGADNTTAIPSNLLLGSTALDFLGIPGMVSYDPEAVLASGAYSLRSLENFDVLTKGWNVTEDVTNYYLQFNLGMMWGDTPVNGNIGVQYVEAEQESTGPSFENGVVTSFTDGDDYNDFLPSMNLNFEFTENDYVRLAMSKTMVRPRMDEMRAGRGLGNNSQICALVNGVPTLGDISHNPEEGQSCIGAGGGNPRLQPYEANSYDVSYEKYFTDEASNIAIAWFYKDILSWISGGTTLIDVSEEVTEIFGADFLADNPNLAVGTLSAPINTQGGHITGVELSTNLSGGLFSPALENFGLYFSYTYNDSEITPEAGLPPTDIPGFSREIKNASIYYENDNFQARLSSRDRSDFLGEVVGFGANRDFRDVNGENVIDAQLGYTFTQGRFQGSSILLQAYNLTDEEFRTFLNDDPRQVKDWQRYGTSYILGFNYKF
ncbi:MAG: TonB-dependent receptor [Gammaproteobacteria bacterium]|nr:TonB-dependent receptor [Gammaproteobacteria bacterium]